MHVRAPRHVQPSPRDPALLPRGVLAPRGPGRAAQGRLGHRPLRGWGRASDEGSGSGERQRLRALPPGAPRRERLRRGPHPQGDPGRSSLAQLPAILAGAGRRDACLRAQRRPRARPAARPPAPFPCPPRRAERFRVRVLRPARAPRGPVAALQRAAAFPRAPRRNRGLRPRAALLRAGQFPLRRRRRAVRPRAPAHPGLGRHPTAGAAHADAQMRRTRAAPSTRRGSRSAPTRPSRRGDILQRAAHERGRLAPAGGRAGRGRAGRRSRGRTLRPGAGTPLAVASGEAAAVS